MTPCINQPMRRLNSISHAVLMASLFCSAIACPGYAQMPQSSRSVQDEEVNASALQIALTSIRRKAEGGFKALRAGIGRTIDDFTYYPSSIAIPGASKTDIMVPQDSNRRPYVDADIYSGDNKSTAIKKYDTYVEKLKTIFPTWRGTEGKKSNDERGERQRFSLELNETDVTIEMSYYFYSKSGSCSVSLRVIAPESAKPEETHQPILKGVGKEDKDLSTAAKEILKKLVASDYQGIRKEFNGDMLRAVSAEKLEEGWNILNKQLGRIKSQDEPEWRQVQGWNIVIIRCEMEKGYMEVEIGYDTHGKIGALWIRPGQRIP